MLRLSSTTLLRILHSVGDDWQAIYRFSGGRLTLTTRFAETIGSHTESKLQRTFRYNDSIADIAGKFVSKNKEQIKKKIVTEIKSAAPQVYLLDDQVNGQRDAQGKLVQVVQTIRENDPEGSIAIIARYNSVLEESRQSIGRSRLLRQVEFWTFHRSKGLETDYTILIGLNSGPLGFPNSKTEEAPLEALLPELDGYLFSEERRLFYVGLTRARYKSYLIASPLSPSEFVKELLTNNYPIEVASQKFQSAIWRISSALAAHKAILSDSKVIMGTTMRAQLESLVPLQQVYALNVNPH